VSSIDGTAIAGPPMLEPEEAEEALRAAVADHRAWAVVPLDERRQRVSAAVEALEAHRELLALLLVWEVGKALPAVHGRG